MAGRKGAIDIKKRLPLVFSIPHGKGTVPAGLSPHILPSSQEILLDGDLWADTLYDLQDMVLHVEKAKAPRLIVDMNRAVDDFSPDGIIKKESLFGNPVWLVGPDPLLFDHLLNTYYVAYHDALLAAAKRPAVRLGIDCHTMWAEDPFGENTEERPLICLSNLGDEEGELLNEPLSAPGALLKDMQKAFESEFGEGSVGLNTPFRGGAIIKKMRDATRIPWVQLEVNRSLYEPEDKKRLTPVPKGKDWEKVVLIRGMIRTCLARIDYDDPRYRRFPFLHTPPKRPRADD